MKNQALFSSKDKKKLKCSLLQFLFVALRVMLKEKRLFLTKRSSLICVNTPQKSAGDI